MTDAPFAAATSARLRALVEDLYPLERDLVSAGFDEALSRIGRRVPLKLHRYPSGTDAWTWRMPDRWELNSGRIETLDGRVVVDSRNCSLHVARYSMAVDRVVSREELLAHCHVHPVLPDAVPYQFFFYRDEWGFCLRHAEHAALTDAEYRVHIDVQRGPGAVTVGEAVVSGRYEDSIVLIAHVDHPWMVNDDLTGVAVGVELFERLRALPNPPRYTWRLLLLPETIGSVAWLAERADCYSKMHGGVFLEMLGRGFPHRLQRSLSGTAHVDRLLEMVLQEADSSMRAHPFRSVIGNDERQFNGPGVRVPCASVSRVRQPVLESAAHTAGASAWPYDEYHSHLDDVAHCDFEALTDSAEALWRWVVAIEADAVVDAHYQGEIFLSRYGLDRELEVSWYRDPVAYKTFFDVMDRIDGTRAISDIALEIGSRFSDVLRIVEAFERHGLASRRPQPPPRDSR